MLSLGSVINTAGLHRAVKEALSAVLPRVVGAWLHISPTPQTFAHSWLYLTQGQEGMKRQGPCSEDSHREVEGLVECLERAFWKKRAEAEAQRMNLHRNPEMSETEGDFELTCLR